MRHPMQVIVCLSHLYGDTLYYATSLFDHYVNGISYCRPEGYYFWLYYFLMNFIWIVVPFCECAVFLREGFRISHAWNRSRLSLSKRHDYLPGFQEPARGNWTAQVSVVDNIRRLPTIFTAYICIRHPAGRLQILQTNTDGHSSEYQRVQ